MLVELLLGLNEISFTFFLFFIFKLELRPVLLQFFVQLFPQLLLISLENILRDALQALDALVHLVHLVQSVCHELLWWQLVKLYALRVEDRNFASFLFLVFLIKRGVRIVFVQLNLDSNEVLLVLCLPLLLLKWLLRDSVDLAFELLNDLAVFLLTEDVHLLLVSLELSEVNGLAGCFTEEFEVFLV